MTRVHFLLGGERVYITFPPPPELFVYFVCKLLLTLVENNNDDNIIKNKIKKVYMCIIHGALSVHR